MTQTALQDRLPASGARLTEYGGAQTVAVFSSPDEEFRALRQGCGIFDLGWRAKMRITGRDRVRWMNGMVSNNIRDLAPGRGVYSFLLNAQGHILGDMNVFQRGEYLVLETDVAQAEKLVSTLKRYIIMDDVQITEAGDKLTGLGLEGPKTGEVLRAAGFLTPPADPLAIEDAVWQEVGISLVRTRTSGCEIWLSPEHSPRVWEALVAAGATPAGVEALEMWRVAAGIPRYGQDIHERDLPQETGQDAALNFTKGCYIGQEIVERIRSRGAVHRRLTGFIFSGGTPTPGTKLQKDGREIGEITSVASLPGPSSRIALGLGYVRREAGGAGAKLDVNGVEATLTDLPFQV